MTTGSPTIRPGCDADLDATAARRAHHARQVTSTFEAEAPEVDQIARGFGGLLAAGWATRRETTGATAAAAP